jgi:hypothetical protein
MPIGAGVGSFRTLMLSVTSFSWFVQSSYAMSKRRTQVQIISFLLKKVASDPFCLHRAGHGDVSPVSLLSDRHALKWRVPALRDTVGVRGRRHQAENSSCGKHF